MDPQNVPLHRTPISRFLYKVVRSPIWKGVIVVAMVLLLFGSSMQFIFFPKEADIIFDILYTVAFGVFIIDTIMNVIVNPEYFSFNMWCWSKQMPEGQTTASRSFGIGSFMFWCDVVSSIAMLYDISYINEQQFKAPKIDIQLDQYGIPVSLVLHHRNNCINQGGSRCTSRG